MTKEQEIFNAAIAEKLSPTLANLMIAQSKHESGPDYSNNAARKYNNAFGYKYVGQKIYDSAGNNVVSRGNTSSEGNSYAAYTSVYWSAIEVARWIKRHIKNYNSITTPDQYAAALKQNGYYGDNIATYAGGLRKYFINAIQLTTKYAKNNPVKSGIVTSVVVAMISYSVWLVLRKKK